MAGQRQRFSTKGRRDRYDLPRKCPEARARSTSRCEGGFADGFSVPLEKFPDRVVLIAVQTNG
jgi:hypothetical protein